VLLSFYYPIMLHCKKELAVFPSPAGMSLIKLFLGENNLVFSRPERVWSVTSRQGTGKWLTLFYSVLGDLDSCAKQLSIGGGGGQVGGSPATSCWSPLPPPGPKGVALYTSLAKMPVHSWRLLMEHCDGKRGRQLSVICNSVITIVGVDESFSC
jgi:hypothetical protein